MLLLPYASSTRLININLIDGEADRCGTKRSTKIKGKKERKREIKMRSINGERNAAWLVMPKRKFV